MTKKQQAAVSATKRRNKGVRRAAAAMEPVIDLVTGEPIYCRIKGYSTRPKQAKASKASASYALTVE